MKDMDKLKAVQAQLDARGICNNIEFPGFLHIELPDGRALCAGLEGEQWMANTTQNDAHSAVSITIDSQGQVAEQLVAHVQALIVAIRTEQEGGR